MIQNYPDNENSFPVRKALQLLRAGAMLQLAGQAVLIVQRNEKILVSGSDLNARMTPEMFEEIYEFETFTLRPEVEGIDEKKDDEYYRWRAIHQ